ncbi:MAG: hypothetical protein HYV27_06860 [Candidatus Hydrogenedentes bacterium]|nr:hypothetical protein [Candidatus Hydrogenedentota bacterium]
MDHSVTRKAWEFLYDHKCSGKPFTTEEIKKATGWSDSTVRTYRTKKWRKHLQKDGRAYRVVGFDGFALEDFIALHTQVSN